MSAGTIPARGHMPFPGHRTCAEWDRPVHLNRNRTSEQRQFSATSTEADRLARRADIPLVLAQMVVIHCNRENVTLKKLRSASRRSWLVEIRRAIAVEARPRFSLPEIGRALNRDHTSVINLLERAAR